MIMKMSCQKICLLKTKEQILLVDVLILKLTYLIVLYTNLPEYDQSNS